jgi:hypothetical protein
MQYNIFPFDIDSNIDVLYFNNKGARYLPSDKVLENEIDGV